VKKFRERNLLVVAAISAVVMVVAGLLALNFSKIFGGQKNYSADFQTAVGIQPGDVVTIAGVRVGAVSGMTLHRSGQETVARVTFYITGAYHLGDKTAVDAKVLNPVGVEYLEVVPAGPGTLSGTIPVSRTTVPGTLVSDLNQLTNQTQQTDIPQLVKSLQVITQTLEANTPAQTKAALNGVAALSAVLAGRQQQLTTLVTQADQLTSLLNSHSVQLVSLLGESNLILQVLEQRKSAIDNLLATTSQLTNQIDHIIAGDRSVLDPMLANLNAVSGFLARDSTDLGSAIPLLAAFSRYSANLAGSGPYADFVAPTLVIPDNVIDQCASLPSVSALMGCRI
jgi:phospholipid/cholesterol/gamma-HCH transport system substrate-binding protein